MRGMWEGTPFPAFLLIKKVTKESDKLSKNKGSFRGDFYLIGKISCEIKKHTEDFFSKYPCVFVYVPERIRTAGLPLRRRTLYPAELQKHKYKAGRMILMRSALYNNLSGKKNQVLFSNKHPVETSL